MIGSSSIKNGWNTVTRSLQFGTKEDVQVESLIDSQENGTAVYRDRARKVWSNPFRENELWKVLTAQ